METQRGWRNEEKQTTDCMLSWSSFIGPADAKSTVQHTVLSCIVLWLRQGPPLQAVIQNYIKINKEYNKSFLQKHSSSFSNKHVNKRCFFFFFFFSERVKRRLLSQQIIVSIHSQHISTKTDAFSLKRLPGQFQVISHPSPVILYVH